MLPLHVANKIPEVSTVVRRLIHHVRTCYMILLNQIPRQVGALPDQSPVA